MASRVKELLDELASTLSELGMLDEAGEAEESTEGVDGAPADRSAVEAVEARQAQYDSLLAKAERIKAAIAKAEAAEARKNELLKVLNRAAPVETAVKTRIEAVSYRGYKPGVFQSPEVAHRCGQWLKAHFGDRNARQWCSDNLGTEYRDMLSLIHI